MLLVELGSRGVRWEMEGLMGDSRLGGRARDELHCPRGDDGHASNHGDAIEA
jgi:hypothetical protein